MVKFEVLLHRPGKFNDLEKQMEIPQQNVSVAKSGPWSETSETLVAALLLPRFRPGPSFLTFLPWFPGLWNGTTSKGCMLHGAFSWSVVKTACVRHACAVSTRGLHVCMMRAQGRHVCLMPAQRVHVPHTYMYNVCVAPGAHCSVSLSPGGSVMMMSLPSFPDVESETQRILRTCPRL